MDPEALADAKVFPESYSKLEQLLENGASFPAIDREMLAEGSKHWRAWARAILARWSEDEKAFAPWRKDRHRAMLLGVYRRALDEGALKVAVDAAAALGKLDGLYEPSRIEVTGAGGLRSPEAVEEQIRALLADPRVRAKFGNESGP